MLPFFVESMNRAFQFTLFFSGFLLIYTALNSYILLRLGGLLEVKKNILYGLIIFFTLSFPLVPMIEKDFPNQLTEAIYTVSALWMGIAFFFFITLLCYELVRLAVPVQQFSAGITILIVVGVLTLYAVINAVPLHIKEVQVPVSGLSRNMTVVQLSDVHIGTIRNSGFLRKIAEKTNNIDPDLVLITGDVVDGSAPLHSSMFSPFDRIRAPIYFVSGNHETYEGVASVEKLLNETKIKTLHNRKAEVLGIQILGVNYSMERGHLRRMLHQLEVNASKPAILMYHSPSDAEDAKAAGIDLQLSGHTHNGQIFPFNLIVQLVFPYVTGLYDLKGTYLYVSPGTGTWGPYMRLGSRNEITVLKLTRS